MNEKKIQTILKMHYQNYYYWNKTEFGIEKDFFFFYFIQITNETHKYFPFVIIIDFSSKNKWDWIEGFGFQNLCL